MIEVGAARVTDERLGIGFAGAATAACVRAERAIADAEDRLRKRSDLRLAAAIDQTYALVTGLSDVLGDLASNDAPDARDDERKAVRARVTYHRLLATTGLLLALNRL